MSSSLSFEQLIVLGALRPTGGHTLKATAEWTGIGEKRVGRIIDELVRAGFVEGKESFVIPWNKRGPATDAVGELFEPDYINSLGTLKPDLEAIETIQAAARCSVDWVVEMDLVDDLSSYADKIRMAYSVYLALGRSLTKTMANKREQDTATKMLDEVSNVMAVRRPYDESKRGLPTPADLIRLKAQYRHSFKL